MESAMLGYLRITKHLDKDNITPTMDRFTVEAGLIVNKKEKEVKYFEMAKDTLECGARARKTVLGSFSLKTEVTTRENS